tara:strand:+ start:827 stop:1801 length:975 start_codon:yes stop_codon:yes gene_type:complete
MMNRPLIERISTFVLRSAVFFIVVSFFLRALSEVSSRGLGLFVDLVSAALALIPAISAVVYLHFRRQLPFGKLLCILSLPIGLLYTGVGLLGMAAFANDYRLIGPSAAILLLPALYGGVLSAVGHLWNDGEFDLSDNNISFVELCFLQTIFLVLTIWAIDNAIGLSVLSDLRVPALFLSLFILAIYLAKDRDSPIATTIADASLAGVLLCLVVCLIAWFGSAEDLDRRAITFGSFGMVFGTYAYTSAFILSLYTGGASSINYAKKNWHLVEANTFFVFLLFVPQNVGEVLRSADSAIELQVLEQKLEMLTERLEALEISVAEGR